MSTMSLKVASGRRHRALRWSQVKQHLAEWRYCARSRRELMNLSDECLRDIGISRCDVMFESSKPFWMA